MEQRYPLLEYAILSAHVKKGRSSLALLRTQDSGMYYILLEKKNSLIQKYQSEYQSFLGGEERRKKAAFTISSTTAESTIFPSLHCGRGLVISPTMSHSHTILNPLAREKYKHSDTVTETSLAGRVIDCH